MDLKRIEAENKSGIFLNLEDIKNVIENHKITSWQLFMISEKDELLSSPDFEDCADFVYSESTRLEPELLFKHGIAYYTGNGQEMKRDTAATYFVMAAERDNVLSMVNAGMMFLNGDGVEQNFWEAFYWFFKGAMKGNERAIYFVGDFYMNGYGVVKENHKYAAKYYEVSAKMKHPASQYNLGVMKLQGDGVYENTEEGIALINEAAKSGFKPAIEVLSSLRKLGMNI